MSKKILRLGLIGAGRMGSFHARPLPATFPVPALQPSPTLLRVRRRVWPQS